MKVKKLYRSNRFLVNVQKIMICKFCKCDMFNSFKDTINRKCTEEVKKKKTQTRQEVSKSKF